jgi:hypothetical protein
VPGHGEDNKRVARDFDDSLTGCRVPHLQKSAVTGGNKLFAVGTDGQAAEFFPVASKSGFLAFVRLERGGVPNPDGSIQAGGDQALAVWAEGHAPATIGVSAKAEHLPEGRRVPEVQSLVLTG